MPEKIDRPDKSSDCVHARALRRVTERYEQLVQTLSVLCEMDRIEGASATLEELAHNILRCLASGLAAQNCSLHLLDSQGERLTMKAGWGPADDIPSQRRGVHLKHSFRLGEGILGHVAHTGEPLRVDDAPAHPLYEPLSDSSVEVRSLICYPVRAEGRIAGVLNLSHSRPSFFTQEHEHLVGLLADRAGAILMNHLLRARLRESNERLEKSLREKEVLLREVHHRVKNNLQLVSSMLDLQADTVGDERARELIEEAHRRVRSIAMVHQRLYQHEDIEQVDFAEYASALTDYLSGIHRGEGESARIELEAQPTPMRLETAIPCGLILNELTTNALRHAFDGGPPGHIAVEIAPTGAGEIRMAVVDDGVGLPESIDIESPQTLGLQIVSMLTLQTGGRLIAGPGKNGRGAAFEILLPDPLAPGETPS